jgi:uncharacterized protein YraI
MSKPCQHGRPIGNNWNANGNCDAQTNLRSIMKTLVNQFIVLTVLVCLPTLALGGQGYAVDSTTLFSRPDSHSSTLRAISAGTSLSVKGCTKDYAWCAVTVDKDRGWMVANQIRYPYNGARELLSSHGAATGVPIVSFAVSLSWGRALPASTQTPDRTSLKSIPTRPLGHIRARN